MDAEPQLLGSERDLTQSYCAITRHTDGRIIHVRNFQASNDAEAVEVVTARGNDIRTDLWGDRGLVKRFGVTGS